VELAVLLPLLLCMLVGVWEVGRMVEVKQMLTNAAREGARQASTGHKTIAGTKNVVVRYLHAHGITAVTAEQVTVVNMTSSARPDPTDAEQLDRFRITVTIPFSSVRWIALAQITPTSTLVGEADWVSMVDIPITVNSVIPLE
jgi:Flp pilus assembly protein TadG